MAEKQGPKCLKRVLVEFEQCTKELPNYNSMVQLTKKDDYYEQKFTVQGPVGSPYEGGKFDLLMSLPLEYPHKAPELKFVTKIYHPNVKTDTGEVCHLMYSKDWKPTGKKIIDIIQIIISMMQSPNLETPLEPDIAKECGGDAKAYIEKAKQWTKQHAMKL